jgi:thiol:disulfide interchange protein
MNTSIVILGIAALVAVWMVVIFAALALKFRNEEAGKGCMVGAIIFVIIAAICVTQAVVRADHESGYQKNPALNSE